MSCRSSRLKALEDSWETLNRFKEDLGKSRTQLVRLQAPEDGLAALIATATKSSARDWTNSTGASSRPSTRIVQVVEQFGKLDSIRKEINGLFTKLSGTVDGLR